MPVNNLRPKMLDQYPGISFLDYFEQKMEDAYKTGDANKIEATSKALQGNLRNLSELEASEALRQVDLTRARQIAQERNEREQAAYEQENAERLANFKGILAGPITNVREVGPAGYQPGYQGGLDFASLQGTQPPPPDNKYGQSLLDGITQGSKVAIDQKQGLLSQQQEQGFFGNIGDYINEDFLGRVLAIMARPEAFTDPRGLGAGIARAGQAVFAQEKEQAAAAAKKKLEYDKIQADLQKEKIKAGKKPEFKQFMAKMVTDVRQQKQGLDTVQKIKRLLGKEGAGGIAGAFESFVSDAGAIFGASGGQSVNQQIEKYNAYLLSSLGSGIASGQISQEDYKRIDAMLKAPGITTDAGKLLDAYNEVERVIGGAYKTNADMLREVGYGKLIEPSVARDRGIQVPD
jgi:hypothetical protein